MSVERRAINPITRPRLGVDIGRVILADTTDNSVGLFSRDFSVENSSFVEGAIDALHSLNEDVRWDGIYLVSKCSPRIQDRTLQVLHFNNFFTRTNVLETSVRFCLHQADKARVASELKLTHFIDDRVGVLNKMPETVGTRLLFFANEQDAQPYEFRRPESKIIPVRGWQNAYLRLMETLE